MTPHGSIRILSVPFQIINGLHLFGLGLKRCGKSVSRWRCLLVEVRTLPAFESGLRDGFSQSIFRSSMDSASSNLVCRLFNLVSRLRGYPAEVGKLPDFGLGLLDRFD